MRTARTPSIAYATRGASGPRVLLVMGLGMRGAVWEPQLARLEVDHQLAFYDHRGVGDSEPAARAYRMVDLARDALGVADALGWDRFHVGGVSLGGMVAQELALLAPTRVRSLSLLASHAGGPLGMLPTLVCRPGRDILVRPFHSDRLGRGIPGARVVHFPTAGHGLLLQEADGVAAALRTHVARVEAGR